MKYFKLFTLIILSLIIITCNKSEDEATDLSYTRKAVPVEVEEAMTQTFVSELSYNGTLLAIQTARIIPEIPAKIEDLKVQIGDQVAKGDLLVQMDISTLNLQYKQAEAGLSVAQANLADTEKNWERVQSLRADGAVSQQQFEKAKLGLEAARSQLNQAKAGVDLLRMQLDKARLTAPFPGVITQKGFEEGDLFSPAVMMPVYTLQNISRIKIELQVTSREIMSITKGQHAELHLDYLDAPIKGEVTLVSLAADPLSKTFFVECQFDNASGLLRAGTFGQVNIAIAEIPEVVVIPKTSVIDGSHVFIIEDDLAYRRDIEILEESLEEYIVGSGLDAGEVFVVSGAYILADSSLVEIKD